ncbi:hypothetical protein PENANT_c003G01907 [Penicillium antarcticum]|uniref:BTB domain-containing protein n=1 Tax=Penicillium antarcticum TaxID=416450 RepID=A0A1V6QI78_9EURO|nr:uncharacterized protein N7508_005629 [Penicillium antarcticum]KAJ5306614.1 hypothetical protein N7508_005629 [Penicillium antarcticum]OQD88928.1 hypothetical protein PENANT_c003G01907 [Penicillium antarcticum]
MTEPNDSPTSVIVNFVASGEVILVVGPEQLQLRASSRVLKTASKPAVNPAKYPLPEDNAIAMKYICAVIHHQNNMLPRPINAQDIFEMSVIVDRYDFFGALEFASDAWLAHKDESPRGLIHLTAAAYIFQNAEAFKKNTSALVLTYGGSFLDLAAEDVQSVLDWEIVRECF